jgi:peptidoglycan hydrolase-like protein with peptidoglycan-binding domain
VDGGSGNVQSQELEHTNGKTSVDGNSGNVQAGQKLTVGSRGPEVEEFQKQLNAWRATKGLPPIAVDGIFGKQSAEAVKQFQLATGLSTDGIAGPNTKTQLQKELNSIA